jgi:hypothetical protein
MLASHHHHYLAMAALIENIEEERPNVPESDDERPF